MKNIVKYLGLFAFTAVVLIACSKDKTTYESQKFPENAFTFFESANLVVKEAVDEPIAIKLMLANSKEAHTSDVTVDFTLETKAKEGVDYKILDGKKSFNFKPGVFEDVLKIEPLDNLKEDGDKELVFTLKSTSANLNLGYIGTNANNKSTLLIQDDDCALVPKAFTGTPSGTEQSGSIKEPQPSVATFTLISSTPTTAKYKIENLFGAQFKAWKEKVTKGGEYFITLDYTDPSNPKVIAEDNGDPLGNNLAYFYAQTNNEWGYYFKLKEASFSTCSKTLMLSFVIDVTNQSTGKVYADDNKSILNLQF